MGLGRTIICSLLVVSYSAGLAQTSPDPSELFQEAARTIEANAKALPRFACTETVARSIYVVPDKLKSTGISDASPNDLPGLEAERRLDPSLDLEWPNTITKYLSKVVISPLRPEMAVTS